MENRAKLLVSLGGAVVVALALVVTTVGPWFAGNPGGGGGGGAGNPGNPPGGTPPGSVVPPASTNPGGNAGTGGGGSGSGTGSGSGGTGSGGGGQGGAGGPSGPMGPPPKWGLRMAFHHDNAAQAALDHRMDSRGKHLGLTQVPLSDLHTPVSMSRG